MKRLASAALLALLAACAAPQVPTVAPSPSTPPATATPVLPPTTPQAGIQHRDAVAPYRFAAIDVEFPLRIGAFELRQHQRYSDPRLGESLAYDLRGGIGLANLYVYDAGQAQIPDGVESAPLREQLGMARMDLERGWRVRFPGTPEPSFQGTRMLRCGQVSLIEARYRARNASQTELDTRVLMTGYRRQFIKLRVTLPMQLTEQQPAVLDDFLGGVCTLLLKGGQSA